MPSATERRCASTCAPKRSGRLVTEPAGVASEACITAYFETPKNTAKQRATFTNASAPMRPMARPLTLPLDSVSHTVVDDLFTIKLSSRDQFVVPFLYNLKFIVFDFQLEQRDLVTADELRRDGSAS